MQIYSPFFQTLYDEPGPVGHLGRGTHYSILRAVVWHDEYLQVLPRAAFLDFAVIWDEDHDERVLDVIHELYFKGLLSPIEFVGERKGNLSVVLHEETFPEMVHSSSNYADDIDLLLQTVPVDDPWCSNVVVRSGQLGYIINDGQKRVEIYLENIRQLWNLGIKPAKA